MDVRRGDETEERLAHAPVRRLRSWLAERTEYERVLIARLWSLPSAVAWTADTLADAMLSMPIVGQLVSSLGPREQAALALVQAHGGSIPAPQLEREFGAIRAPTDYPNPRQYLLALERPATPTERLYMLALVQPMHKGTRRFYSIPADVLPLLPAVAPYDRTLHLEPTTDPAQVLESEIRTLERNVLMLLTLAQDGQLEVIPSGGLNKASMIRVARQGDSEAAIREISREEQWPYVQFLRRVLLSARLLHVNAESLLRPTREALAWMRLPLTERIQQLLQGWIESTWDELVSLGGVQLHRAYDRDLAAAKRAVVALLGQVPLDTWVSLRAFVVAVKALEPDFARPDGRYDSWGLINHLRQPIDGFEYWEDVEGRQLCAIVSYTLHWLGMVDLGLCGEQVESFRLNLLGGAMLAGRPLPVEPEPEPLVVQPNFEVLVPANAQPYARFQLRRIADRTHSGIVEIYTLTRRSVQQALGRGISLDDIVQFLCEQSGGALPQNVLATLGEWACQHGRVRLRHAVLLEANEAMLLEQIRRDKRVRMPQVEQLSDTTWLLREGDVAALAERLHKYGYGLMEDGTIAAGPLREHDLTVLFSALEFYAHACAALGVESSASMALRQRIARLLPEKRLNRAYQISAEALQRLKQQLEGTES